LKDVNRRHELAPLQPIISMLYRADRRRDPAPNDIAALEGLLVNIAMFPDALFCRLGDALPTVTNLRPPFEGYDLNEVLDAQSEAISGKSKES
jgi:hypothetical protein